MFLTKPLPCLIFFINNTLKNLLDAMNNIYNFVTLLQVVIICAGNTNFVLYTLNLQCILYSLTHRCISANLYDLFYVHIHIRVKIIKDKK